MTDTGKILEVLLSEPDRYFSNHEIRERIGFIDDSTISARERDTLKDKIEGRIRTGTKYKEWRIKKGQPELFAVESKYERQHNEPL